MPKIVNHQERRNELSRVIVRSIAKHGSDRITMRGIAKEGGFSSGALAHYFTNKEEMINFAVSALADEVYEKIDKKMANCDSALEKLRIIVQEHLPGRADESMAVISMAFWGSALHDKTLAGQFSQIYGRWRQYLTHCLEEAVESKEIKPLPNVQDEVDLIVAMTDGLLVSFSLEPSHFPQVRRDRLVDTILSRLQKQ